MVLPHVLTRRDLVSSLVDLTRGHGLEVGPLDATIALRTIADVSYCDVQDQAGLRDHYRDEQLVDPAEIPVIDYVLTTPDGVLTLADAVRPGAPFDWVVASHVVEHVPDLIQWFDDLAEVTRDEAQVVLIIPDRRYCFDIHRQQTTVGQMLEANELHQTRPSVRAVYDNFSTAAAVDAAAAWAGSLPAEAARHHDLDFVQARLALAKRGEYVDCHVWTFTPTTFADQVDELGRLGLCDLVVDRILPTPRDSIEFVAVLRRLARDLTVEDRAARRTAAAREVADETSRHFRSSARPEAILAAAEVTLLRQQIGSLEAELRAVKDSQRWRVGGLVAEPAARMLRAVSPVRRHAQRAKRS